jgi:hypothetical protein
MKDLKRLSLVAALTGSLISGALKLDAAVTPLQTGSYSFIFDGNTFDVDTGTQSIFTDTTLSGFTKFDASLGTLNKVIVSIQFDASVSITLSSTDLNDPGQPFTLFWDGSTSTVQSGVVYNPGGGSTGLAVTIDTPNLSDLGVFDGDPNDFEDFEVGGFFYFDDLFDTYGGNVSNTFTTGEILASDPSFNLADFQGVGNVTSLTLALFAEIDTAVTSQNIGSAQLDLTADVNDFGGTVQLQYEYTPVPEPRMFAGLAGLAALLLIWTRRRMRACPVRN